MVRMRVNQSLAFPERVEPGMSIARKALKEASWLAIFKAFSQIFSWASTVLVARMLVPGDYGLMNMATLITGYTMLFSELGLGAAIVQRPKPVEKELSSLFWLILGLSCLLAIGCFAIAYPTALIFNEPRVIPITQTVSVLFLISGLQVVPLNLLTKGIHFKRIGFIEMTGIIVSCGFMLTAAYLGAGVWTLIGGHIVRNTTKLVLIYSSIKWFPKLHFAFQDVKSYLTFGMTVSLSRSLFYIYEKSDIFFAGRAWMLNALGLYSFALQLAKIPTDKIVSLINRVSFPLFSQLQDNQEKMNEIYIKIVRITATLVFPIYVGGYLLGDELVKVLLNEKWFPMIFLFKCLCLSQIITALSAINNRRHTAQGRPHWNLCFHTTLAVTMGSSFYFAVNYGLNYILVPWFTTYVIVCVLWIFISLRKMGIDITIYLKNLFSPFMATLVMSIFVLLTDNNIFLFEHLEINPVFKLVLTILIACAFYILYLWFFDRSIIEDLRKLRKF